MTIFTLGLGLVLTASSCYLLRRRAARALAYLVVVMSSALMIVGVAGWISGLGPRMLAALPILVLGAIPLLVDALVRLTGGPRAVAAYLAVASGLSRRLALYSPRDGSASLTEVEIAYWHDALERWRSPQTQAVIDRQVAVLDAWPTGNAALDQDLVKALDKLNEEITLLHGSASRGADVRLISRLVGQE